VAVRGAEAIESGRRTSLISEAALELASQALETLACPVTLDRRDFVEALRDRPESVDVAWIGLSLHHLQTPEKLSVMRQMRSVVGDRVPPNLLERDPRRRGPRPLALTLGREAVVDRIGTRRMRRRESPCVRQRFSRNDLSVACAGPQSRLWASAGAVRSANKSFPGVLF
jgi:hypothetical protein